VGAVIAPIAVSASHQFSDVADTNIFHDNIAWLADNNVTKGCNPPTNDRYCPDDNVTRGQMAAFMQRLAEGKIVDAATAVTADMLDGMDSTDFTTTASSQAFDWYNPLGPNIGLTATPTGILETSVTAPADGVLLVNGAASYGNSGSAGDWFLHWLEVDDGTCAWDVGLFIPSNAINGTFMWVSSDDAGSEYAATSVGLVEVGAGSHTVTLCSSHSAADGDFIHGNVIATYLPDGSASAIIPPAASLSSAQGGNS
jgi:hypothetical protein